MTNSIHLSLDAMGGDNAPQIIVDGAAQSKIRYPDVKFSFFGNKYKLLPLVNSLKILKNSEITNQKDTINQFNIDKSELEFLRLNLTYSHKCRKSFLNTKGFRVGSSEYKKCVLNKGRKINE